MSTSSRPIFARHGDPLIEAFNISRSADHESVALLMGLRGMRSAILAVGALTGVEGMAESWMDGTGFEWCLGSFRSSGLHCQSRKKKSRDVVAGA